MSNIETENRKFGLNSFVLRVIAMAAMTFGAAYELVPNSQVDWGTYMLWFSYTIFAFLIVEGASKTSNKRLYFRRLLLFAVLTEIPFDLLMSQKIWDPGRQSVMLTLLIGYLIVLVVNYIKDNLDNMIATLIGLIAVGYLASRLIVFLNCDVGYYGVLIICFFYICRNVTYSKTMQLICCILFLMYVTADNYLNIMVDDLYYSIPDKGFMVLGIALTWLYNGRRGPNGLAVRIVYYSYFPVVFLLLYLIKYRMAAG